MKILKTAGKVIAAPVLFCVFLLARCFQFFLKVCGAVAVSYTHLDSNLKREDVPENLLENYTFEDKVTGVPVDCNPMVIYYNADLFKELNIKSPQEYVDEGKWNFEALQQVSEQLRDASKVGFGYENWWGPLYSFLFSAEDPVYSDDMTKAEFGSERAKAGLTYLDSNIKSKAFTFAGSLTSGESPDVYKRQYKRKGVFLHKHPEFLKKRVDNFIVRCYYGSTLK